MPSPRRLISSVISLVLLVIGLAEPRGVGLLIIAIGVVGLVLNGMLIQRDRVEAQQSKSKGKGGGTTPGAGTRPGRKRK
jgi:hypothetical protein